ncbi:hypothetical protein D3C73_1301410 [compost metagenome]
MVHAGGNPLEDPIEVGRGFGNQFLRNRQFAEVRFRVIRQGDNAHVFRVIGHAMEIQRAPLELHFKAHRVHDGHAQ